MRAFLALVGGARPAPDAGVEPVTTTSADGVRLAGVFCPGPRNAPLAFVVAHGMSHSTSRSSTRAIIRHLSRTGAVVALDFRGHGRSAGRSSVGRDEPLDVDAAVALIRQRAPQAAVVTIGFSMGGATVLQQAGLGRQPPDVVVAVSPAPRWYIRDSGSMRRVHWLLEHPLGPLVGRFLGIRLGSVWTDVPLTPLELIGRIRQPLLLIQGTADSYFTPTDGRLLVRASAGHGELWVEPGMAHAESGTTVELLDRITAWAAASLEGEPTAT